MENVIKKAIEGGYKPVFAGSVVEDIQWNLVHEEWYKDFILDPLFWQALGKACGWDKQWIYGWITRYSRTGEGKWEWFRSGDPDVETKNCNMVTFKDEYIYHSLRFHEINLTESWTAAVEYLQSIMD